MQVGDGVRAIGLLAECTGSYFRRPDEDEYLVYHLKSGRVDTTIEPFGEDAVVLEQNPVRLSLEEVLGWINLRIFECTNLCGQHYDKKMSGYFHDRETSLAQYAKPLPCEVPAEPLSFPENLLADIYGRAGKRTVDTHPYIRACYRKLVRLELGLAEKAELSAEEEAAVAYWMRADEDSYYEEKPHVDVHTKCEDAAFTEERIYKETIEYLAKCILSKEEYAFYKRIYRQSSYTGSPNIEDCLLRERVLERFREKGQYIGRNLLDISLELQEKRYAKGFLEGKQMTEKAHSVISADTPIEDLDLSVHVYNAYKRAKKDTLGALLQGDELPRGMQREKCKQSLAKSLRETAEKAKQQAETRDDAVKQQLVLIAEIKQFVRLLEKEE